MSAPTPGVTSLPYRLEIDLDQLQHTANYSNVGEAVRMVVEPFAKRHHLSVIVDDLYRFAPHHLQKDDFTRYPNGHKMGGAVRYKEEGLRIPRQHVMPCYTQADLDAGKKPRLLLEIPKLVLARFDFLQEEELLMAGFEWSDMFDSKGNHKIAVEDLRNYPGYETLTDKSFVSFPYHGRALFNPTKKQVDELAKTPRRLLACAGLKILRK